MSDRALTAIVVTNAFGRCRRTRPSGHSGRRGRPSSIRDGALGMPTPTRPRPGAIDETTVIVTSCRRCAGLCGGRGC